MVEFAQTHPLGDIHALVAAHQAGGDAGIVVGIAEACSTAQLFARNGEADKLAKKLKVGTAPGLATVGKDFTAIPLSPGQWMMVDHKGQSGFAHDISAKVKKLGYVSQQSDARVRLRVSGPQARELMSRGCRLDLHGDIAGAGFCAQTIMAQVGTLLHQVDDAPSYDLYVYSGFARSFYHWLTHSAEQFGYRLEVI